MILSLAAFVMISTNGMTAPPVENPKVYLRTLVAMVLGVFDAAPTAIDACSVHLYSGDMAVRFQWSRDTKGALVSVSARGWNFDKTGAKARIQVLVDGEPFEDAAGGARTITHMAAATQGDILLPSRFVVMPLLRKGAELRIVFPDGVDPEVQFHLRTIAQVSHALETCWADIGASSRE